jgi:phosphate acetyltransferase
MTVRIAFADVHDPRVVHAAAQLADTRKVKPVLIGSALPELPAGCEQVIPDESRTDLEMLADYVLADLAYGGVAGAASTSADVIRTGIKRLRPLGLVTGSFAMRHLTGWATYADCSVLPVPSVGQLADIAESAAEHHRAMLGEEPRIAMLSFSTNGSAQHPQVDHVRAATDLLKRRRPDLLVEGEIQFDVAVDALVGRRKLPDSDVAGRANVLIFPSLEAGNIAYKVAERIGGVRALGSFVLNLSRPWVDLSRGCSVDDIVDTVTLLANAHVTAPEPLTDTSNVTQKDIA